MISRIPDFELFTSLIYFDENTKKQTYSDWFKNSRKFVKLRGTSMIVSLHNLKFSKSVNNQQIENCTAKKINSDQVAVYELLFGQGRRKV